MKNRTSFKQLFDFKGTIDGNKYVARPLLGYLFFIPSMFGAIDNSGTLSAILVGLGFVASLVLGLSSLTKRLRALGHNPLYTILGIAGGYLALFGLIAAAPSAGLAFSFIFGLFMLGFGIHLTFTNSDCENDG